jgi:hypothetical protein
MNPLVCDRKASLFDLCHGRGDGEFDISSDSQGFGIGTWFSASGNVCLQGVIDFKSLNAPIASSPVHSHRLSLDRAREVENGKVSESSTQ